MYKVINRDDIAISYGTHFYEKQEDVPNPGNTIDLYTDGESDSPEAFIVVEVMQAREAHTNTDGVLYVREAPAYSEKDLNQGLDDIAKGLCETMIGRKDYRDKICTFRSINLNQYICTKCINTTVCSPGLIMSQATLDIVIKGNVGVDFVMLEREKI